MHVASLAQRMRSTTGRLLRATRDPSILANTRELRNADPIIVEWPVSGAVSKNWGDALNPIMVQLLSGRSAIPRSAVLNIWRHPIYFLIGSGLGWVADPLAVIYGYGFNSYRQSARVKLRRVAAVRGPLTRSKLLQQKIDVPAVVGDLALLLPMFYEPSVSEKRFEFGVIPHFRERDHPVWRSVANRLGALNIDICGSLKGVVDQVASCEIIISSSLHGLIIADAYGTKSVWARASNDIQGDYFKFHDYLNSVGRTAELEPLWLEEDVELGSIKRRIGEAGDMPDLERLIEACPFANGSNARMVNPGFVVELLSQ